MHCTRERRAAIEAIAEELCSGKDMVEGIRIIELVRNSPLTEVEIEGQIDLDAAALPRTVSYRLAPSPAPPVSSCDLPYSVSKVSQKLAD